MNLQCHGISWQKARLQKVFYRTMSRSSRSWENNSGRPVGRENTSEGDQEPGNRWNVHPSGEDSEGVNGGLPVQETGNHFEEQRPDRQVLPENDQQRNADRSQVVDHSCCDRKELQLMCDRFNRMRLWDDLLDDIEGRSCNGTFIWKIRNFHQCRQEAIDGVVTALYSPAIYTKNQHGYKFCVRLHLNGVDTGVGSHVAVFVHMLQGEYDHRLPWPFTGAIVLSILEQSNAQHRNDVSESVMASPNLLAFQMPSATCCHIGCGFKKFAPIDQVCGPQYIKNDTMLVRIEVFNK